MRSVETFVETTLAETGRRLPTTFTEEMSRSSGRRRRVKGLGVLRELVQRDRSLVIADEMDVQAVLLAPREGEGQLALEVGLHGATADVADGAWEGLSSSIVEDLDDEATALGMHRTCTQGKGEEHPQR